MGPRSMCSILRLPVQNLAVSGVRIQFHPVRTIQTFNKGMSSLNVQAKVMVGNNFLINYDKTGDGPHPVLCLPGALGKLHLFAVRLDYKITPSDLCIFECSFWIGFIESDFGPILPKFDSTKFTLITWDPPGNVPSLFLPINEIYICLSQKSNKSDTCRIRQKPSS